ncbi:hypothetical protein C8N35_10564 [Breoghania corrubedonensis]|uniref:PLL-like beta propeller domain-containing protein n=1 Tax=Breoghania corrubedonensis TaxID=665038 RepID=A0A2T5V8K9_9HYPH|nr:hypothetical protein [Breoghania corrubedonensis]PTW60064.1 hypothetical protein C8N35_10564 [Breoghania corrubedonensis]
MVEEAGAKAAADDTTALLEDDVAVVPSNDRDAVTEPVAAANMRILVGALVAGAGGGCTLVTTVQQSPDGSFPPAGSAVPVNDVAYDPVLAGATAMDGRIVFAAVRAADKGVDLIFQHGGEFASGPAFPDTPGAEWDTPLDLGRPAETVFTELLIGLDALGRTSVFGVSDVGDVWWLFKKPPKVVEREITITPPGAREPITIKVPELGPADPPFSGWQKLDGATVTKLALANNADDRIILFAITDGGDVVFNEPRVMNASDPSDWYGWEVVSGDGLAPFTEIGASLDDSERVNVFALDAQNEISHARQVKAGCRAWTGYVHPGLTLAGLGCLAVGLNASGNVALGAASHDNVAWTNLERVAVPGEWGGWQPSAHVPATTAMAFGFNANRALALFGLTPADEGGTVWMVAQAAPGSSEWSAFGTSVLDGAVTMAVVRDLSIAAG